MAQVRAGSTPFEQEFVCGTRIKPSDQQLHLSNCTDIQLRGKRADMCPCVCNSGMWISGGQCHQNSD